MRRATPIVEITDAILEVGGRSVLQCMQCGACTSLCPWGLVDDAVSPRTILREVALGLDAADPDALWRCLTCTTCAARCPREVDIIDVVRSTRALMTESGATPRALRAPLASLASHGNPWGAPQEERCAWTRALPDTPIPEYGGAGQELLHVCCTHAYDGRNRRVVAELAELLSRGGLSFGTLGDAEVCCGDPALSCGGLDVAGKLAARRGEALEAIDAIAATQATDGTSVVATSPHCLGAFDAGAARTRHYTQVLDEMIAGGRLAPRRPVERRIAYHDPCYLGRQRGVYDEPRRVLASIPGVQLVDLPRQREDSLCCGGGGGGAFHEIPVEQRLAVLRAREVLEAGADTIATACPFCTIMLEDGVRALGAEERIEVLDVAELLHASVVGTVTGRRTPSSVRR